MSQASPLGRRLTRALVLLSLGILLASLTGCHHDNGMGGSSGVNPSASAPSAPPGSPGAGIPGTGIPGASSAPQGSKPGGP